MAIKPYQIKKWNNYFKSLTKAEKRIAIAKDILQQIKLKKYIPYSGSYITFKNYYNINNELDIQANFDKAQCNCCQLGACIMSLTKFENKLKFSDIQYAESDNKSWKMLEKIFTPRQIAIMEYCFEGDEGGSKVAEDFFKYELDKETIEKCDEFKNKYFSDEDTMKAICNNLIKNKGEIKF
jgi:hypothetical protein